MNGSFQQISLSMSNHQEAQQQQQQQQQQQTTTTGVSTVFYKTPQPVSTSHATKLKIATLLKERDVPAARSRGSSSSSQVTLTTSYSKIEDEGNNNQCHHPHHNNRAETGKMEGKTDLREKRKCKCWNCEKKKKGITSLTNRCLFKGKSQSATLETIVKKIGFLPNSSRSKLFKDCENKNGAEDQGNHKPKLTKTFSSFTISNSSLQDLDESEFTSSELADIMGQMKQGEEVQV